MSRAAVAVIAVVAILAVVGMYVYNEYCDCPEYHVGDVHEAMGLVTFTATADLDEAMTVTVWAGDAKMSMMGVDEWTVPEGPWEQTFIMTLPDGMDLESFDGCLEIHFDGKAGWRR